MKQIFALVIAILSVASLSGQTQDSGAVIDAVSKTLGAANLRTLEYSGSGYDYVFGQAYHGTTPWPRFNVPAYTMTIDFAANAVRDDKRRLQLETPALGGGFQPIFGEMRQIWVANGEYAWDVNGGSPGAPRFRDDRRPVATGRLEQITLTPHGFIKAAMAAGGNVRVEDVRGIKKTFIAFTKPGAKYEATVNDQNLIERIEGWFGSPVMGDTTIEAIFTDYRDVNGIKFPGHIVQRQGGYPLLDVAVTDVKVNPAVNIEVPENIRTMKPAPLVGAPERLADGVWAVPTYAKSIAIEFRDHIVIVEAPEHEAQSVAVMEAVRKTIPNKPIRYVINTHSHFDHIGGLRAYAAEGTTIVTHRDNIPYYQQLWAGSWTLSPDRLMKSGKTPVFEGVLGSRIMTDGSRSLNVYHYPGNLHNPGMLMVYLPKEKILIEADSFSTPAGPLAAPPHGLANMGQWYDFVQKLRLDVDVLVPIHGAITTMDAPREILERFSPNQTR
jgi:glyoxylase-like metal-dependent hydrolase (beta-lactamase superfamily II)